MTVGSESRPYPMTAGSTLRLRQGFGGHVGEPALTMTARSESGPYPMTPRLPGSRFPVPGSRFPASGSRY